VERIDLNALVSERVAVNAFHRVGTGLRALLARSAAVEGDEQREGGEDDRERDHGKLKISEALWHRAGFEPAQCRCEFLWAG
jgi:hypothetical protein